MPPVADTISTFLVVWIEAAEGFCLALDYVVPGDLPARVNVLLACFSVSMLLYRSFYIEGCVLIAWSILGELSISSPFTH